MSSQLRSALEQQIKAWATLGIPALIERFMVKYGEDFVGSKRPKGVKKQKAKECFRNAALACSKEVGLEYYEGYAMHRTLQFPFLHAWNVKDAVVIDVTLDQPDRYEYFGMKFDRKTLWTEQVTNGVYGLLDIGVINLDLLRKLDNDLVEEALRVRSSVKSES